MNFAFSDEQELLRRTARELLETHAPLTVARAAMETRPAHDADLWKRFAEAGWQAMAIPEAFGGAGFGYLELAVIAEELGRSLAPTAFSSSVYLAAEAILRAGSDAQRTTYLPDLVSGARIGTFVMSQDVTTDGARLDGVAVPVPDAEVADIVVVAARDRILVADLRARGITIEPLAGLDQTRSYARVTFDGVETDPLGDAGALDEVLDRAAVLFAFEQVGGAQRCMEMAIAYARERYQFGRAIGSFQAIKHRLADMLVEIELARSNCYFGAWAAQHGARELPVAACLARISACRASDFAAKENLQIHGGIGFTWEADPHLFLKRAKTLELVLSGPSHWRELLLQRQG